ncbi:hypothetical protein KCP69_20850 [Salmonella enterica subsp. enterica]|nr:hypothetical protein KCP69_20850 [Salmonella enterica subsp. enterica]
MDLCPQTAHISRNPCQISRCWSRRANRTGPRTRELRRSTIAIIQRAPLTGAFVHYRASFAIICGSLASDRRLYPLQRALKRRGGK